MEFSRQEHWSGVAISCCKGSSQPRDQILLSASLALAGRFFTTTATWEAHKYIHIYICVYTHILHTHMHTHTQTHIHVHTPILYTTHTHPPANSYPLGSSVHGEFSSQEFWSWYTFPCPGNLHDPGIEPRSDLLHCRQILYSLSHQGSPLSQHIYI